MYKYVFTITIGRTRCDFEFCHVCGAEWKKKNPTCKCDLWDEHNIIHEPLTDDDDYYDFEEEYEIDGEDYEFEPLSACTVGQGIMNSKGIMLLQSFQKASGYWNLTISLDADDMCLK
ncbi:hypothetical protein SUGI_0231910 [Cryptomeria japonica]|nr:hypothetical protein SUGI_0231910 [Cryptomeria japonica]